MDGETDVPPQSESEETTEETIKEEQHLPTTEERLEHCYDEIRTLRAEIAELRSHSHAELAHATHEHEQYSSHDHKHEQPPDSDHTSEPVERDESSRRASDATPSATHPYFRPVKEVFGRG